MSMRRFTSAILNAASKLSGNPDAKLLAGGQTLIASMKLRLASPAQLIDLRDVAEVRIGHPAPIGDAVINDGPGLLLIVEKQPWGNTLDVTREVERALADLKPGLADVELDSTIFRPATFIEMSLSNLNRALLIGCVLVVIVLALFLVPMTVLGVWMLWYQTSQVDQDTMGKSPES
mgnify:CR=1 FL=1